MNKVIILAGPGSEAFNRTDVDALAKAIEATGHPVTIIGDGENAITLDTICQTFADIAACTDDPITVIVMTHGILRPGQHHLDLGEKENLLPTARLFDHITKAFGQRPVDVFMMACHGGAALSAVNNLPAGSTLAVLSPAAERVSSFDTKRLAQHIDTADISAQHLLKIYLCKALKARIAPSLAVSGQGLRNLPREFIARCGKPFSDEDKRMAHNALDDLVEPKKIDTLLEKTSTASHDQNITALEYGAALAITLTASTQMENVSTHNLQNISYQHLSTKFNRKRRILSAVDEGSQPQLLRNAHPLRRLNKDLKPLKYRIEPKK